MRGLVLVVILALTSLQGFSQFSLEEEYLGDDDQFNSIVASPVNTGGF